jgi:hypothetical protein
VNGAGDVDWRMECGRCRYEYKRDKVHKEIERKSFSAEFQQGFYTGALIFSTDYFLRLSVVLAFMCRVCPHFIFLYFRIFIS